MKIRRTLRIFIASLVFLGITVYFLSVLFSGQSMAARIYLLEYFEKQRLGGVIKNNTDHNITITEWCERKELKPDQSSRDVGVFDTDSIVIERPVIFENKGYNNGVIKICDFSSAKISQKGNLDVIEPSFSYRFCKIFSDVGWYPSTHKAFHH